MESAARFAAFVAEPGSADTFDVRGRGRRVRRDAVLRLPWTRSWRACHALAGIAGITCSARIYIVRARPAWFSGYTVAEFFSTALLLGPAFVHLLDPHAPAALLLASVAGGAAQLLVQSGKFLWLSRSETFELRSSSLLLAGRLQSSLCLAVG